MRYILILLLLISGIFSTSTIWSQEKITNEVFKQNQAIQVGKLFTQGLNRRPCIEILRRITNPSEPLNYWANLFNVPFWIPVIPTECVVCKEDTNTENYVEKKQVNGREVLDYNNEGRGERVQINVECENGDGSTVPLPLDLLPHMILRLVGLIFSITLYAVLLVAVMIGIRFVLSGFTKSGVYLDTSSNLRTALSAVGVGLVAGSILLQILTGVLALDDSQIVIKKSCIPTSNKKVLNAEVLAQRRIAGQTGATAITISFCFKQNPDGTPVLLQKQNSAGEPLYYNNQLEYRETTTVTAFPVLEYQIE
jgi:hypothetical protein